MNLHSFLIPSSMPSLFAATPGSSEVWIGMIVVAISLLVFGTIIVLMKQYKRCPSNRVLVIYGKAGGRHESAQCIHGGARFIKPLLEDYAWLSLEPMQIEIPLRGALSMENIRVNVPSVFTVAIGTTPELMQNAAIRLLGLNRRSRLKT
jgi:flotillin